MPRVHRSLVTRGYELDAASTIPPWVVLRYLEHMRWESLEEPETGLAVLFTDGFRMVVRAQQLEIVEAIGLHAELNISLWLSRIGGASMDMRHDVVRAQDGRVVARALVTVVYLNPSWRPERIPDAVRHLVQPGEHAPLLLAPTLEIPEVTWSRKLTVMPSDADLFGHVNHANYMAYFDDTRRFAASAPAYGASSALGERPVARAALDYRKEALPGDVLTVLTWCETDCEGAFGFALRRDSDGEVLCRARIEV